ncbi:hypothetical protein CPB84DRAFT_1791863 [Gymnopilus junonius]|uniref:DUF6534 domain-containing protein n=1 Tax=Gymnopilus junonius TaxID=109634 RepID=A0A9P5TIF3_GYMJU|nr:hypothetical protein CPB84DRAFT_1791863 [Gymnopilus junonius]
MTNLLHWGLFGSLSTQVYIYFLAFPNDPRWTQMLVYGLYIAEVIQTILLTQSAFSSFAEGFGNLNAVNEEKNLWFSVPIMSSAIAAVVQVFYAYRIRILAQSYIVPSIIILLSFIQLAGGIATGIIAHQSRLFSHALCDVIIAAGMTYYLTTKKTSWKQTRKIVRKLIRLIIETGTLTAKLLPSDIRNPGKMYSTTMMVVFNSRTRIVGGESSIEYMSEVMRRLAPLTHGLVWCFRTGHYYTGAVYLPLDNWTPANKKAEEASAPRGA